MRKMLIPFIFIFTVAAFNSCNPPASTTKATALANPDNGRTFLDWDGIYRGVLLCAVCEGIQTTIYLNRDLGYRLKIKYLGKEDSVHEYSGKFSWNAQGNTITLDKIGNSNQPPSYFAGENTLTQLDMNGNRIMDKTANQYILSKDSYAILEKYWKLTELNGKPILMDSSFSKEPHIILKENNNRFIGNGGCNNISGTYKLQYPNRISFSKATATQMACSHLDIESMFLQALENADSYTINGDNLVLNRARMAPLARFKTVYMK